MKQFKFNCNLIPLIDAKTKVLTAFEQSFGKDFVYSKHLNFEFSTKDFNIVYKILNAYLFDNKLNNNKLHVYQCNSNEFKLFRQKMNIIQDNAKYYAAYIPEVNNATGKICRETILLMDDNGKMTFMFAVSCLCHEMIHQYDANYGILINVLKEDKYKGFINSHKTPIFVRYMKLAALEGIKVMTSAGSTPFDILNQEAVQFTMNLQEDNNDKFLELVEQLKRGKKLKNMCLTDRNTVAFFVP